jgi:2-polyprenyl-6-methoxyphenol hydroxylase-like FAD-dependent oxidoreductase
MKALIIGGGIGGATAAIALLRAGIQTTVYERAPEAREVGAGISLWGNAVGALRRIGAADRIVAAGDALQTAELRTDRGRLLSRIDVGRLDSDLGTPSFVIHRADLLAGLIAALPTRAVRFGRTFVTAEERGGRVIARFDDGSEDDADLLVGADGVHSAVRSLLNGGDRPTRYAGYTSWRGLCDFPESLAPRGAAVELWGRGRRFGITRLGADPLAAAHGRGRVYWFGVVNAPRDSRFADHKAALRRSFPADRWSGGPVGDLIEATLPEDIIQTDICDRPARRGPGAAWSSPSGRIVLLGDAAHPTTPNLGQGACMAIEDGVVLARLLTRTASTPEAVAEYQTRRFHRSAPIVNTSWLIGRIGNLENPVLCTLRNFFTTLSPKALTAKQHRQVVGFSA